MNKYMTIALMVSACAAGSLVLNAASDGGGAGGVRDTVFDTERRDLQQQYAKLESELTAVDARLIELNDLERLGESGLSLSGMREKILAAGFNDGATLAMLDILGVGLRLREVSSEEKDALVEFLGSPEGEIIGSLSTEGSILESGQILKNVFGRGIRVSIGDDASFMPPLLQKPHLRRGMSSEELKRVTERYCVVVIASKVVMDNAGISEKLQKKWLAAATGYTFE